MPSTGPFAAFDWPHLITLVTVTAGVRDQTTFDWTNPTETRTTIYGHFDPFPSTRTIEESMMERRDGGNVEAGDALFFTESAVKIGDKLEVHEDDTGTNFGTWIVKAVSPHGVVKKVTGIDRKACLLKRQFDVRTS